MRKRGACIFIISTWFTVVVSAQEQQSGPIIKDFGKVWKIENPDFVTNTDGEFKVVFDIMYSPENLNELNRSIETSARFLNMHAQAGVPNENLKAVLVVHNKASKDIITDEAYQKRYGMNNPNAEMITQLMDAGVDIIFCGQSSFSRKFLKQDLLPNVKLGLSAMTALIQLQNEGYRLIKF